MADDKEKSGGFDSEGSPGNEEDDGGISNLPPLSDFDSGTFQSDGGLPPLGEQDSGKASKGGLPPLDDIQVETPEPTGGNIKSPPPGFDSGPSQFDTPAFETPSFSAPKKDSGTGFQDLAADSDFSPETPEIGPGPDTDMDTPLFDSAFGGGPEGTPDFGTPKIDTPAPTQAMETPMFGGAPGADAQTPGFDAGAFGGDAFGGDSPFAAAEPAAGGTPAPDFSPDTGMAAASPGALGGVAEVPPTPPKKKAKGGKGAGILVAVVVAIVGLGAGVFLGGRLTMGFINPSAAKVVEQETEIETLNVRITRLQDVKGDKEGPAVSQEELDRMIKEKETLGAELGEIQKKHGAAEKQFNEISGKLEKVKADLDAKNEEFVRTLEEFEDLQNQTAIIEARQKGLSAEVERLTELTSTLEESNKRRLASKDALSHSVARLLAQVESGMPLTPERFSRQARIDEVKALQSQVEEAKWVTPALLDAYASLYIKELEIAAASEYFFAKIPVKDKLGNPSLKWSECLMRGNWAVSYRSLDGKNIGTYQNLGTTEEPAFGFVECLSKEVKLQIEQEIIAERVPDFEQKVQVLAEKQLIADGSETSFQKVFGSL